MIMQSVKKHNDATSVNFVVGENSCAIFQLLMRVFVPLHGQLLLDRHCNHPNLGRLSPDQLTIIVFLKEVQINGP